MIIHLTWIWMSSFLDYVRPICSLILIITLQLIVDYLIYFANLIKFHVMKWCKSLFRKYHKNKISRRTVSLDNLRVVLFGCSGTRFTSFVPSIKFSWSTWNSEPQSQVMFRVIFSELLLEKYLVLELYFLFAQLL